MEGFSVLPVGELVLDRLKTPVNALSPFSEFVKERPEDDHESSLVPGNLLDILAGLNTWGRWRVGNWCKSTHIVLFRRDDILSTSRPDSIPSPPRLVSVVRRVFVDVPHDSFAHDSQFFHAGFSCISLKTL